MLALTKALADRQDRIRNNDKGFTLIELLVVVIIIGILAAIAIPIFLGQQNQAKDSAIKSDLANAKVTYVSQLVDTPNTVPTAANLTAKGWVPSTTPSTLTITSAGTPAQFCLAMTSTSTGTPSFGVTEAGGVAKGTCAAGVFTAVAP